MAFLVRPHRVRSCSTRTPGLPSLGAFIPGLSEYRSSPVALGTMALYAFLITAVTARWTKLLPPGVWLTIHRLALVVFVLAWLHVELAGSDSGVLAWLYVGTGAGGPVRRCLSLLGVAPAPSHVHHIARGGHRTMSIASLRLRRTLTLIIAVSALLLGFAAIRAASAWTAEAAPLVVSPTAATQIEARLAAEQSRSAELEHRSRR